jgi:hypothetical protein
MLNLLDFIAQLSDPELSGLQLAITEERTRRAHGAVGLAEAQEWMGPRISLYQAQVCTQTTSEHYLPPWGMKPTVSDRRNLVNFHPLTRAH